MWAIFCCSLYVVRFHDPTSEARTRGLIFALCDAKARDWPQWDLRRSSYAFLRQIRCRNLETGFSGFSQGCCVRAVEDCRSNRDLRQVSGVEVGPNDDDVQVR